MTTPEILPLSIKKQQNTENLDGFLVDVFRNPSASATLSLLSLIHFAEEPLSMAKIIASRPGGIYPTRTQEEIELLFKAGLIEISPLSSKEEKKYQTTPAGKIEIALNQIQNPKLINAQLDKALERLRNNPSSLPPEDYGNEEFRFTWKSIRRLIRKILADHAYRKINIVALGTPLVAIFLSQCPDIINTLSCLDINPMLTSLVNNLGEANISALTYDARHEPPITLQNRYDALIMDPPWHSEYYLQFADRAWQLLRPLGKVYMSIFSPETRPEAKQELTELYSRFTTGGFFLYAIIPEFFGYQVPEFEQKVFREQGIPVSSRGDYGTLVVLERNFQREEPCLTSDMEEKVNQEKSITLTYKNRRMTIWTNNNHNCSPNTEPLTITPFNEGKTYLSTSRSQRKKDKINGLNGNQVAFSINHPEIVIFIWNLRQQNKSEEEIVALLQNHFSYSSLSQAEQDYKTAILFFRKELYNE